MRPHLDYSPVIYDQPNNECFTQKTEKIHYNDALAITGAIKGAHQNKLCRELGFESLNLDVGLRKYAYSLKLKQLIYQNTCLTLFHELIIYKIFA